MGLLYSFAAFADFASFVAPCQGACGSYATSADHITAPSQQEWQGNCNRQLVITNSQNGRTTTAIVQGLLSACTASSLRGLTSDFPRPV